MNLFSCSRRSLRLEIAKMHLRLEKSPKKSDSLQLDWNFRNPKLDFAFSLVWFVRSIEKYSTIFYYFLYKTFI